jgi:RNA polymerase sigma factor (sigma-70 family)
MASIETSEGTSRGFDAVLSDLLQRLRPILLARHGMQIGSDVHAEVTAFAWEHRARLTSMANPAGYLFRVSQSRARRYHRWRRPIDLPPERTAAGLTADAEVRLDAALARVSRDERTVAVLVHAYGYSYEETADLLGVTTATVRNRLHRAMTNLRRHLEEDQPREHR